MKQFLFTALVSCLLWASTSLFLASLQLPTLAQIPFGTRPTPVLTSTNDPGSDGLTVVNSLKVGGADYFLAVGNSPGLYKTDGTASGTLQLSSLSPAYPFDLVNLSGTIFFEATDTATGTELYKTDGTVAGTVRVADIQSGSGSASPSGLTVLGTKVFFSADDGTYGQELWASDGSATKRVANINTQPIKGRGVKQDKGSSPASLVAIGTSLYFTADDGITGKELWKYDGSTVSQVKDLYIGNDTDGTPFASNPTDLTVNGSNLYFSAYTPATGTDLFVSDGASTGTVAVDIYTGAGDSKPEWLTVVGDKLYLAATDAAHGKELFKVSGATATLVSDLYAGTTGSEPESLTAIGTTLWFTAQKDTTTGYEVFRTDGTNILNSGKPWDINPGAGSSNAGLFTQVGSDVYFIADNGINGYELQKSAGGTSTPVLFKNINTVATKPGASTDLGSFPYFITPLSSASFVFFAATNDAGTQLYKSDTTAANTAILKKLDTSARVAPSLPIAVDGANGVLLSLRYSPNEGQELYAGSTLLKDINPGPGSSQVSDLTVFNGQTYFLAFDGTSTNLWKTDGTTPRTQKVTAEPGVAQTLTVGKYGNSAPPWVGAPIGQRTFKSGLFYTVPIKNKVTVEIHLKLLTTDGLVTDVKTLNTTGSPVLEMVATGSNGLLFSNDDGSHGQEPWVSDGTAAGTQLLKDVNPGSGGSYPYSISESVNDSFYYDQSCNAPGYPQNSGHWSTAHCQAPSLPLVYFLADDGHGIGLFSTDGQQDSDKVYYTHDQASGTQAFLRGRATGTQRIAAMDYKGSDGGNNMEVSHNPNSYSNLLTAYLSQSQAYEPHLLRYKAMPIGSFTAASGSVAAPPYGLTYKVDDFDLNPAPGGGSGASGFITVNTPKGAVSATEPQYTVFNADAGTVGNELYVAIRTKETNKAFDVCSDPTCHDNAITMALVADLFPGKDARGVQNSSNPRYFVRSGNAVYFLADTASGMQIFKTVGTPVSTAIYTALPARNTPISLAIQGATLKVTSRFVVKGESDRFNTFDIPVK